MYRSFYPDLFVACHPGGHHPFYRDTGLLES